MEVTKLSTKGQIVIPDSIRKNLDVGTLFMVTRKDDLIVLKQIEGLNKKEEAEIKELSAIWKQIDTGKKLTESAFFDEFDKW